MTDSPEVVLRLAETVDVLVAEEGIRLVRGPECLRLRGDRSVLSRVADVVRRGIPERQIEALPADAGLARLVRTLRGLGWLTTGDPSSAAGQHVERQFGYLTMLGPTPAEMQERLSRSRVGIVGVGGVGGCVLHHLAAAGVRQFWLVDNDSVELHNLNRQLIFGHHDIGTPKTAAAKASMARFLPDLEIETLDERIVSADQLGRLPDDIDLLVVAADSPPDIVDIAWERAESTGFPLATAAVGLETGYWGPLSGAAAEACWTCFEAQRKASLSEAELAIEAAGGTPSPYSFGPVNTVISAMFAYEIVKYLATGDTSMRNRRTYMSFPSGELNHLAGVTGPCRHAKGRVPS